LYQYVHKIGPIAEAGSKKEEEKEEEEEEEDCEPAYSMSNYRFPPRLLP